MPRFPRAFQNTTLVLSLTLSAATAILWARSYSVGDHLFWCNGARCADVLSSRGMFELSWEWPKTPGSLNPYLNRNYEAFPPTDLASSRPWEPGAIHFFGFHFGTQRGTIALWFAIMIPLWFLSALFAIFPLRQLWLWSRHVARRIQFAERLLANQCPICGYDLRATPAHCPECGKPSVLTENSPETQPSLALGKKP